MVSAVWFTNREQHAAATRAFEESQSGQGMLTAMLDQQTGLRGFALTRREEYLDAYRKGQTDFKLAAAEARSLAGPVLANLRLLAIAETRAATDALTGLPNARSCTDTLKRMVAHAGRTLSPPSAVLLDLDHFKQINDRFGHGAGDDVLAAVGQTLAGTVRASDFAGRLGGEEFVLLLPDTDQAGALEVAEKVRNAIAQLDIARVEREITASLAIATYPLDATDGENLLRQADRALYAAKAAGRNPVELTTCSTAQGLAP